MMIAKNGKALRVHLYARYSSTNQDGNDSIRRQTELATKLCDDHGWKLARSVYVDKAKSAFKGGEQDDLARFLAAVEAGKIKSGDVLFVESLDRLSREAPRRAFVQIAKLLDAGIHVAVTSPATYFYDANSDDLIGDFQLLLGASSAHAYSKQLQKRIKSYYKNQRALARSGKPFARCTAHLPCWLEKTGDSGKLRVKAQAVKAIRFIFDQTIKGVGRTKLCATMNEKFEPIGRSGKWNQAFIANILKTKKVIGHLESTIEPETFLNHYPPVISETVWKKANAAIARRRHDRGPQTNDVNLFQGILFHAVDDCTMRVQTQSRTHKNGDVIKAVRYRSSNAVDGVDGSHGATVLREKLEQLVFNFLPTLNLEKSEDVADLNTLKDQRSLFEAEIEELEEKISNAAPGSKQRESNKRLLDRTCTAFDSVEKDITALEADESELLPSQSYFKRMASMGRASFAERTLVKDRIRDVVKRIDVLPIKLGPVKRDPVKVLLEITFRAGEFVRAIELDDGQLAKVSGKVATSLSEQCADGWRFGVDEYHEAIKLVEKMKKKR